jgi:hypothetical protein
MTAKGQRYRPAANRRLAMQGASLPAFDPAFLDVLRCLREAGLLTKARGDEPRPADARTRHA